MLGVIIARASHLKKYGSPYINIVKALVSTTKTYIWNSVSHGILVDPKINPEILSAKMTVQYKHSLEDVEFSREFAITRQSPNAIYNLHREVGEFFKGLIASASNDVPISKADLEITDHFYGRTLYTLGESDKL